MFFDDKKLKKVDLGNKKVESKEEFLKKLREDKQNELKKTKQQENNMKIKKFLNLYKKKFCSSEIYIKTLKNLKSVKALLDVKKEFDYNTCEKIIVTTFEKLKDDLQKIYKSNLRNVEELTMIILSLLQKFSNEKLFIFLNLNKELIINIHIASIIHLHYLLKKDYLIEEKLGFFVLSKILETLKNEELYKFIYMTLAKRESVLYFFNTILKNSKKLITEQTKRVVMGITVELNIFTNFSQQKVFQTFFENSVSFILNSKQLYSSQTNFILKIFSKIDNYLIMKYFTEADFNFMIKNISEEISNREKRNDYFPHEYTTNTKNNELFENIKNKNARALLNLFEMFFYYYRKIDMKLIKPEEKANIMKCIYNILEFIFEFFSKYEKIKMSENICLGNMNNIITSSTKSKNSDSNPYISIITKFNSNTSNLIDIDNYNIQNANYPINFHNSNILGEKNYKNQENFRNKINVDLTEKLILIVYQSTKIIKKLYEQNYDGSNFISLLDLIINKIALKTNEDIINTILMFSLKFIDFKNENVGVHTFNMKDLNKYFQIISFCVYSKIEYRENFFFIEFKNSWSIYQNIPFNFIYLNNLTKLLINAFSYLINKKDIEYIERLNDNVIIHCLKSLYNLDSEIQFSHSKDNFWSNMELMSKIQKFSPKKLIQAMKLMPFIFPFVYRLTFLNNHLKSVKRSAQRTNIYNQNYNYDDEDDNNYNINIAFSVHRKSIFEETLALYLENKLRPFAKWSITFINDFGMKEEGVDAGGLFKEFMYKLSEDAFSPKFGFFIESNLGFLMPNPKSNKLCDMDTKVFEFLGFIVGVALVEDIKIWPNFNTFFLNNILGIENSFIELKNLDPEYFKNLVNLKNYQGDIENDFGLNFTIDDEDENGKIKNIELIKNGKNINVNQNNMLSYIRTVSKYKLTDSVYYQCENFKNGILKVIDEEALKMFTSDEMRQLIFGFDKEIDINDMKLNTHYERFNFNNTDELRAVEDFWSILFELDSREKEKLLFFVTSLKRPPIVGFKGLHPKLTLYKSDKEVPTSSTCGNILFLPILPKNKMRDIIRYVINADSGFYYG